MKFRRTFGLILSLVMTFNICAYSRDISTYDYLTAQNSEILTRLRDEGLPNARINEFLNEMDSEAEKLQVPEDLYTLEEYFLVILFNVVLANEDFADVCGAFDIAFQPELTYMLENDMAIPDTFSEFFLSVMYENIKPEIPDVSDDIGYYEEEAVPEVSEDNTPSVTVPEKEYIFKDVKEDFWAYEHIVSLYEKGIVDGYLEKIFRPSAKVTRAELAKTVCKAFLSGKHKAEKSKYTDISDMLWYSEYVKICEYYSIFDKICNETFNGDEFVTRQEMCTVIYRAFLNSHKKINFQEKQDFPDMDSLSPYAVEAVEKLQAAGIIEGFGDYNFYPFYETTRAEVCKVISMLLGI